MTQEEAQRRNWLKFQLSGRSLRHFVNRCPTAITPEEKDKFQMMENLINSLLDDWDENSKKLSKK